MKSYFKTMIFILEAIIAIAVVAWFVLRDPLNIFPDPKVLLNQTTLDVEDIREIGELVTAEYYGESITSYKDAKLKAFNDTDLNEIASNLYDSLLVALYQTDSIVKKQDKITIRPFHFFYKTYKQYFADFRSGYYYYPMLIYAKYKISKSQSTITSLEDLDDCEKAFFKNIHNTLKAGKELDEQYYNIDFKDFSKTIMKVYVSKNAINNEDKKEAIMLGRGWVKAGFAFDSISDFNFRYLPDQQIIHFYHMSPKILNLDVNPWLVPNKIYGFEFIKLSGKITDPDDIKLMKRQCLKKLKDDAIKDKILELALKNAKTNLKDFFSLLTGTEINEVKFINDKYDAYLDIYAGETISRNELFTLDSICRNDFEKLDMTWYDSLNHQRAKLANFVVKLKTKKVQLAKTLVVPLQVNTVYVAKLLANKEADIPTRESLKKMARGNSLSAYDFQWVKDTTVLNRESRELLNKVLVYTQTNDTASYRILSLIVKK